MSLFPTIDVFLLTFFFECYSDEHSGKVKSFMLDILCPLITESDSVSNELLDIILSNIVEPLKSQRKNAYKLARELLLKCSDTLEPYIQAVFTICTLVVTIYNIALLFIAVFQPSSYTGKRR
jgi:sister-chromatid-cohesion protein PDS5